MIVCRGLDGQGREEFWSGSRRFDAVLDSSGTSDKSPNCSGIELAHLWKDIVG